MKQFDSETYKADPSRQVVTRQGKKVRILCTDLNSQLYPILGCIERYVGGRIEDDVAQWTADGRYSIDRDTEQDLFFAPVNHKGWINIYKYESTGDFFSGRDIYPTEEDALCPEYIQNAIWVATIQIEWEE